MAARLRAKCRAAPRHSCRPPGGGRPRLLFWPEAAVTDPLAGRRERSPTARSPMFERARAASLVGPGDIC